MSAHGEIGTGAASAAIGAAVKSAPPVTVAGLTLAGIQLSDWVYIATLVWIMLQAIGWFWDRFWKRRREALEVIRIIRGEDVQ